VFVAAALATYALTRWRNARGQPCEVLVLALQAVLLLTVMLLTACALPSASADKPGVLAAGAWSLIVGVIIVAALAVLHVARFAKALA